MNIEEIQYAIKELEQSKTTVDNVAELANLYIVRDNLINKSEDQFKIYYQLIGNIVRSRENISWEKYLTSRL